MRYPHRVGWTQLVSGQAAAAFDGDLAPHTLQLNFGEPLSGRNAGCEWIFDVSPDALAAVFGEVCIRAVTPRSALVVGRKIRRLVGIRWAFNHALDAVENVSPGDARLDAQRPMEIVIG